jgi:hypothetical protein
MKTVQETTDLIRAGKRLVIAGDEHLLAQLPRGEWIGGTTPYFMGEEGGLFSRELLQVSELPDSVVSVQTSFYDVRLLHRIPHDYHTSGFSFIVIPAFSEVHHAFAKDCSSWPDVFDRPLVGWVAGVELSEVGKVHPKVFDGVTGVSSESKALALHAELPEDIYARACIVNLFKAGTGDVLHFPERGFEVTECYVNNFKHNFADYLIANKIDTREPLVANYMGAMVNVGIQHVDAEARKVTLYAPVFPEVDYRVAVPVEDYAVEFNKLLETGHTKDVVFSCNCILNYLYAGLEGKKTGQMVGPITFGEIAYILLNQTLVYLTIEKM